MEKKSILNVGDNFSITDTITATLTAADYAVSVRTVEDANEALAQVHEADPNCIVAEYELPGTDGVALLESVRESQPDLPFILYTASGDEIIASDAIAAGVTAYLPKDADTERHERVGTQIRRLLDGDQRQAPSNTDQHNGEDEPIEEIGIFDIDAESGEIWLSSSAGHLLGISDKADPSVETLLELVHENDTNEMRDVLEELETIANSTTKTWQWPHPDFDQHILRFTFFSATGSGSDQKTRGVVRTVATAEDEGDFHRFRKAIDEAEISITLADPTQPDVPLVYVNRAFEETTGYSAEAVLGQNCRFLQGEETDPAKVDTLRAAIENEEPVSVELRNYRKDGTRFWNRVTLTPIYDDDGQLVRYLGTQKEITQEKEQQKQLTAERRLITRAIDRLDDLFYVLDTDGNLQRWNDRVPEITGYAERELDGKSALEFFPYEDQRSVSAEIQRMLDGEATMFEATLLTAGGKRIPFEFDGTRLVDETGETMGIVGIGRKVIERKERRQHLDLLARVLRHNLRNRINVIHGRANTIERGTTTDPSESARAIMRASKQLIDITEKERQLVEILQQPPENRYIEVAPVCDRIVSNVESEHPAADLTLNCPNDILIYAGEQFHKAITELVENAVVHNDTGTPVIDISVSKNSDGVQITVKDNAPHIPAVERDVLLEDGVQTPLYHGSGLGLSLVRLLTLRSGGSIGYEANSPTGNSIYLTLPGKDESSGQ